MKAHRTVKAASVAVLSVAVLVGGSLSASAASPEASPAASQTASPNGAPITTMDTCYSENRIFNVRANGYGDYYPNAAPWKVSGTGPATMSLGHTIGVANTYSATASITAKAVTAAVGFDVTKSWNANTNYTIEIPAGQRRTIRGGHHDKLIAFDIYSGTTCIPGSGWKKGNKVGSGVAQEFNGFVYYTQNP